MDSPPPGPKPKSAIPSYLNNGTVLPHNSVSAKEKDKLVASITSSNERRQPVDFHLDGEGSYTQRTANSTSRRPILHSPLSDAARDPRDGSLTSVPSRPASPYTLNPPIDFDGLSWPSEWPRSLACSDASTENLLQVLVRGNVGRQHRRGQRSDCRSLRARSRRYWNASVKIRSGKGYGERPKDTQKPCYSSPRVMKRTCEISSMVPSSMRITTN